MIDAVHVTAALFMTLLPAGAARADGDAVRGEAKFQDCAACHRLETGANNVGPSCTAFLPARRASLRISVTPRRSSAAE
jgi:cytochrome c2